MLNKFFACRHLSLELRLLCFQAAVVEFISVLAISFEVRNKTMKGTIITSMNANPDTQHQNYIDKDIEIKDINDKALIFWIGTESDSTCFNMV